MGFLPFWPFWPKWPKTPILAKPPKTPKNPQKPPRAKCLRCFFQFEKNTKNSPPLWGLSLRGRNRPLSERSPRGGFWGVTLGSTLFWPKRVQRKLVKNQPPPLTFWPKKCKKHLKCAPTLRKKFCNFTPDPLPFFGQKVKNLPPKTQKPTSLRGFWGFWRKLPLSLGFLTPTSKSLWGSGVTKVQSAKPKNPKKPTLVGQKRQKSLKPKRPTHPSQIGQKRPKAFLAKNRPSKGLFGRRPKRRQATKSPVYAFAEGKSVCPLTPETCVVFGRRPKTAKSVILPICPRKKRSKNPQKNDRSSGVIYRPATAKTRVPHTLFGQKEFTLFGQKNE